MERRLRLRDGADFRRVRKRGHSYANRLLRLGVARGLCSHNRYGVVTGKNLGGAVTRNHVRRLLREALRDLHAQLQPGHDLVVVAQPALAGESLAAVRIALTQQLQRAGLLVSGGDGE